MKIIDVIRNSAQLLNMDEEIRLLDQEDDEATLLENEKIFEMFNLVKFSIKDICPRYIPLTREMEIQTEDKSFPLKDIPNYVKMHEAFVDGECVPFKIVNNGKITFEKDGTYYIAYYAYPEINSIFDDLTFTDGLYADVLVFSLCSYYSLGHGLFDEFKRFFALYDERRKTLSELKIFTLPSRRFE